MSQVRGLVLVGHGPAVTAAGAPSELVPVANLPLVAHALAGLRNGGVSDAAVVGPAPQLERIDDCLGDVPGMDVSYIEQDEVNGRCSAAAALAGARPFLDGAPFLVQFGDAILRDKVEPLVDTLDDEALDVLVLVRQARGAQPRLVELSESRLVTHLRSRFHTDEALELAGFYLFSRNRFRRAATTTAELSAAVGHLLEDGARVGARPVEECWRYGGDRLGLLEGNRFLLEGLQRSSIPEGAAQRCEIQGRVAIDPTAEVTDTTVRGPAVIGAAARVAHAYIGPYTSIGSEVMIEGAEIEHSIIFPGASIAHLGRRLEASVVGAGAQVMRDFRLPKALRMQVGAGAEVSLA
jgi:glucose-1-phosphate thymidylyltransferase